MSLHGGLAPQFKPSLSSVEGLTPMEDLRVLGPIRKARHEAFTAGEDVRRFDGLLPLVAQGLLEVLRRRSDGLDSEEPVDFDPTTR